MEKNTNTWKNATVRQNNLSSSWLERNAESNTLCQLQLRAAF